MKRGLLLFLLVWTASRAADAAIHTAHPPMDAIVTSASIKIDGRVDAPAPNVSVVVNGNAPSSVPVVTNEWRLDDVALVPGLNVIKVRADGERDVTLFVTRAPAIEPRPEQKVRLVWMEGTDDELRAIASGTLVPPPDAAGLDRFVREVKEKVPAVFSRAYQGTGIHLVDSDDVDVHTVSFKPFANDFYGLTLGDCGNRNLHGESSVYVGTYRETIVGKLENWSPMSVDDSLDVRITDLSEALGRTAAHEVGHGVGLVTEESASPCAWMNGCLGGHSCPIFQNLHEGMRRFGGGMFVMDPGELTANSARIAEPAKDSRAAARTPSVFCDFDQHYLQAIEPLPPAPLQAQGGSK